jgi:hypothetical protein
MHKSGGRPLGSHLASFTTGSPHILLMLKDFFQNAAR